MTRASSSDSSARQFDTTREGSRTILWGDIESVEEQQFFERRKYGLPSEMNQSFIVKPREGAPVVFEQNAISGHVLRKYQVEGDAWKVEWICYYFINDADKPSFVIDVSDYYETKRKALDCHVTQFQPPGSGASTTPGR